MGLFIVTLAYAMHKCIPVRNAKTKDATLGSMVNSAVFLGNATDSTGNIGSRKSGNPKLHFRFLKLKHVIHRKSKQAYENYLLDILLNDISNPSSNAPSQKVCTKKLYSLFKHSKQDSSGVSALKKDGVTHCDSKECSKIFNSQFHSVFSPKSPLSLGAFCKMKIQDLLDF